MDTVTIHSVWTVVSVVLFVGIVVWAWSGKRRRSFDAAAQLPLEDDDAPGRANDARSRTH